MRYRLAVLTVMFTAAAANAANIFTLTGTTQFGFSDTAQVQAFRTSALSTNVTIAMPLKDESSGGPIAGTEGTVYLMNAIGPGTTAANEVAPPVTVTGLAASYTNRTLWTGLTLLPGTYYVVVVSANPGPSLSLSSAAATSGTQTITVGTGVSDVGSRVASSLAPYAPASSFGGFNPPSQIYITVTGTLSTSPGIFTVTAPTTFGFSDTAQAQAFQTSTSYTNVTIAMPLKDESSGGPIAGTEGTVYLMNAIGSGATAANEVAPPVTVTGLTASYTTVTLWTGLTLPPGKYYVVVVSANPGPSLSLSSAGATSGTQTVTVGTGVSDVGSRVTSSLLAFPPSSNFGGFNPPSQILIVVTGDAGSLPVATPALSKWGLVTLIILLAGVAALSLTKPRLGRATGA
jgi:hypothetical protein